MLTKMYTNIYKYTVLVLVMLMILKMGGNEETSLGSEFFTKCGVGGNGGQGVNPRRYSNIIQA